MNNLFIGLSALILILAAIIAGFSGKIKSKYEGIKSVYILTAGAFLSVLIVLLLVDYKPDTHGSESTFFLALLHSVQVMLAGYEFEGLYKVFKAVDAHSLSFLYLSFLFIFAPICTFGFVLSFFENVTSYIKYLFKYRRDIYILSELTDKSLVLATSIRQKYPKAAIVFMNSNSASCEAVTKAQKIKAVLLKSGIVDIGLKFHSLKSKAAFFVLNENETICIESALKLIGKFNWRKNTYLYILSTSKEGERLLDSVDIGSLSVRRINPPRALAHSMIYDNSITDYCAEHENNKIISTLIVGMGSYGTEILKALLWCGQLPGYEIELNAIDKRYDTESQFGARYPEILALNNNTEDGEARYSLKIYSGIDVNTYEFNTIIPNLINTSVVYVCLGNDELNMETAINLRICFERIGICPVIRAIVYNDYVLNNYRGQIYDIEIIGNITSLFSYDCIINEELENLALKAHLCWCNTSNEKELEKATQLFNKSEYHRNSSIASVIHQKYRTREGLSNEISAMYEHMRWNSYMRTEGYVYSGSPDSRTRNDRAKMHHNLHKYHLLNEEDVNKDKRMVSKN